MASLLNGCGNIQSRGLFCLEKGPLQSSRIHGISFKRLTEIEVSRFSSISRLIYTRSHNFSQSPSTARIYPTRSIIRASLQDKDNDTKYFDFVVIGSGVAGLRYYSPNADCLLLFYCYQPSLVQLSTPRTETVGFGTILTPDETET